MKRYDFDKKRLVDLLSQPSNLTLAQKKQGSPRPLRLTQLRNATQNKRIATEILTPSNRPKEISVHNRISIKNSGNSTSRHTHRPVISESNLYELLRKKHLFIKQENDGISIAKKYFSNREEQDKFIYFLKNIKIAFQKPFKDDYFCRMCREHFIQTYQGLNCPEALFPHQMSSLECQSVKLPQRIIYKNKQTLVLDLDETLIHCNESPLIMSDVILSIQYSQNEQMKAGINIRPGAQLFLQQMSQEFEIIVYTASHSAYASKIISHLDPEKEYISHLLTREHCVMTNVGLFLKNLKVIERPIQKIVLVDNASYSYILQLDNGIPILPYYNNKFDKELEKLKEYLVGMVGVDDVRKYNRQHLQLYKFINQQGIDTVYEKLFNERL